MAVSRVYWSETGVIFIVKLMMVLRSATVYTAKQWLTISHARLAVITQQFVELS